MKSGFSIRRVGPADLNDLLSADIFDGWADRDWTRAFLARTTGLHGEHLMVVAMVGNRIVGFASGAVVHHPDKAPGLFINEVGVDEDQQRRGIATALVRELRAYGRSLGCQSSWLATEEDNGAARALYAALGAEETARVVVYAWDEAPEGPLS